MAEKCCFRLVSNMAAGKKVAEKAWKNFVAKRVELLVVTIEIITEK